MNHNLVVANSILWAAAIIASAILHAPTELTLLLLPLLFIVSLLLNSRRAEQGAAQCGSSQVKEGSVKQ